MSNLTLDTVRNSLLEVSFSIRKKGNTYTDKDAKVRLANLMNVDEKAISATSFYVIPSEYAGPYKAVMDALGRAHDEFDKSTMPIGFKPSGRASSRRAVTAKQILEDNWMQTMAEHSRRVKSSVLAFKAALPGIKQAVQNDPKYAAKYYEAKWPDESEVEDLFVFTIDGPNPIGSFDYLPFTGRMAEFLSKRFESKLAKELEYGQMRTAEELAGYLKNMASALGNNADFLDGKLERKRRPRVVSTLTTNLSEITDKIRTFAVADTESGAALLALADKIEASLKPKQKEASDYKDNAALSRRDAELAAELVSEVEDLGFDF